MDSPAPLAVDDELDLEVTTIAHGGVGVARHDGRVVFVSDAIPGERVRARVTEVRKKSFARAAAVEVFEPSPDRRSHVWPEAGLDRAPEDRAGGAEFGHIALPRQRALKAQVLTEAMQRFGGVDTAVEVEPCPSDPGRNGLGYRTRVRLHVDPETGTVGPVAARSRRVIPVGTLPLASRAVNAVAPLHEAMPGASAVDLVAPSADDPRMLVLPRGERSATGSLGPIRETVEGWEFVVRAGGFWQVHDEAATLLFHAVRDAAAGLGDEGRLDPLAGNLDLYGGAGLLAAALIDAAGASLRVTTVESDARASDDAAENLAATVGALAITARVDRYLRELLDAPSSVRDRLRRGTVVLDPPRAGAGGEVCTGLGELAPANIVYVACDPVALARDTKSLRDHGYELRTLRALDLFPHTHHVESIAVFTR